MLKSKEVNKFMKQNINYSACNEDSNSEQLLFDFSGQEEILCILGGGERFFNLLTYRKGPAKGILLDANQTQQFVFELKKSAYLNFDYEKFCGFIGLSTMSKENRFQSYKILRDGLSTEAIRYWDNNKRIIGRGLIYEGNFEKFLKLISIVMSLFFKKQIRNFFNAQSMEEQQNIYKNQIDGIKWRLILKILCRKRWFQLLSKDPCFYMNSGIGDYYTFFKGVFEHAMTGIPVQENFLLSLILCGKYNLERNILPRCYRKEYFNQVKQMIKSGEFEVVITDLNSFLKNTERKFDCFSLSDVCSYLKIEEIINLFEGVNGVANKNAKIVLRELMTRHDMKGILAKCTCHHRMDRNYDLENKAQRCDSSFIWKFFFYSIKG